jgi:hypothetical protein
MVKWDKLVYFSDLFPILPNLFHLPFKCPNQYHFTYILDDSIRTLDKILFFLKLKIMNSDKKILTFFNKKGTMLCVFALIIKKEGRCLRM